MSSYYAISGIGAVCHTLTLGYSMKQIVY